MTATLPCAPSLQAILGAPLGVTRLMDLLGEQEVSGGWGTGRAGASKLVDSWLECRGRGGELLPPCLLPATDPATLACASCLHPLHPTPRLPPARPPAQVLRNEALLLLTRLAGGSPDLQKIAVFEGAFDRLFGIIR